jgi:hypothetical protein
MNNARLKEVLTLIEANASTKSFDTRLAWDMLRLKTINCLVYGESGAGKSSLVKAITGDESIVVSATHQGTKNETAYDMPCGLRVIDTPGFRVPLTTIGGDDEEKPSWFSIKWWKEVSTFCPSCCIFASLIFVNATQVVIWRNLLKDLNSRLHSLKASDRPLCVMYVQRAANRIIAERIRELLALPHKLMVPVFLIISDVCSVDDKALMQVTGTMQTLIDSIGLNAKGHMVRMLLVNSESKIVRGHEHQR